MTRTQRRVLVVLIIAAALVSTYGWVQVARADIVANWGMNESHNGTVLHDYTGHGYDGTRGDQVIVNGSSHRFTPVPRGVVVDGRLDTVPDSDGLDPGGHKFTVKTRFKWPRDHDNNLVQKGQGSPAGGMFKMKTAVLGEGNPKGGIKCLFRGSIGDSQVESWSNPKVGRLDDGAWHTIVCQRTRNGTSMTVDGVLADTNPKAPGVISNDWPVSIGGNTSCASSECNYWWGRIDYVRWFIG